MMRAAVLGDLHGNILAARLAAKTIRATGIDTLFQVGDCGLLWPDASRQKLVRRMDYFMEHAGAHFWWIDGNHDPHPALRALPAQDNGTRKLSDRLTYLPRGTVLDFDGTIVAALGGAYSIDRQRRKEGKSLWVAQEEPTEAEADLLIDNAAGRRIDVLLTHDAPLAVSRLQGLELPPEIEEQANITRALLQRVAETLKPRILLCGHWHIRHSAILPWDDGSTTRVEVLAADQMWKDSMVELVVDEDRAEVKPLPIRA